MESTRLDDAYAASSSSSSSSSPPPPLDDACHDSEPGHPSFDADADAAAESETAAPKAHPHQQQQQHQHAAAERKRKEGEQDETKQTQTQQNGSISSVDATKLQPPLASSSSSVSSNTNSSSSNLSLAPTALPPPSQQSDIRVEKLIDPTQQLSLTHPPPSHSHSSHPPMVAPTGKSRAPVEESPDKQFSRYKKQLGSGTFKDVYLAIDTESGKEVAWNVVDLKKITNKDSHRIKQEVELLTSLRHPNILQIFASWEDVENQKFVFITERSSNTLKQHISRLHPMKTRVIKKYCRQILTALQYLHSMKPPIIHRDLKCDNVFCASATGDAVLGDFGLSIAKESATSLIGTPGFLAPELFADSYNELVDIWAFGMCVLEMATNSYPYVEANGVVSVLLKRAFEGIKPEGLEEIQDPKLKEFILMCLQPVEKRPSAQQLLEQKVYDLTEETTKKPTPIELAAAPYAAASAAAAAAGAQVAPASAQPVQPAEHDSNATNNTPGQQQLRSESTIGTAAASVSSGSVSTNIPAAATPSTPKVPIDHVPPSSAAAPLSSTPLVHAPKPPAAVASSSSSSSSDSLAKLESLKRRADILIPKFAVAKTDSPAVVSIFLYTRLREDIGDLMALLNEAAADQPPPAPLTANEHTPPDLSKLLLIDIPSYDFSRDNYLAVATNLVRAREELHIASIELENLEELIACKIEECVREKYNKYVASARTQVSSKIMSLLTSLGMNLTYANKMNEQEISYEDLFLLSDADLTEFIPKLGPRRRLQQFLDSERLARQKEAAAQAAAAQAAAASSHSKNGDSKSSKHRLKSRQSNADDSSQQAADGNGSPDDALHKDKKLRRTKPIGSSANTTQVQSDEPSLASSSSSSSSASSSSSSSIVPKPLRLPKASSSEEGESSLRRLTPKDSHTRTPLKQRNNQSDNKIDGE